MAKNVEPSSTSFAWNAIRCTCILLFITIPSLIIGIALYSVFYNVDFPLLVMSMAATIIVSCAGGLWFAYFDIKYTNLLSRAEALLNRLEEKI